MANPFISQGMDMQNPEAVQIMRRQKMSEQLLSQGQEPLQGQMVSGHYVAPSWTQQLAKGLNTYMGAKGMREATEAQQALAQKLRDQRQSEVGQFTQLLQGRPADQLPADQQGPVRSAQGPDMAEVINFAANAQSPELQQFGMQGIAQMPAMAAQKAAREEDRAFRQQEAEANRLGRMDELKMRMEDGQRSQQERLQAQKELREMQIQAQKDMRRMIASNRPSPQAQIIQTDSGPMQLVGGQAVPIVGPDGKAVRGATAGAGGAKPLTEGQAKGSLFLGQMRSATGELDKLPNVSPVATSMTGNTMTNWAAGKDAQKVAQLQNQWAEAYLRAKTGAAATEGEVKGNIRTFFPVVGDTPEVIAQKKQMRRQAEQDMVPTAGPGAATAGMPVAMPERAASPQDTQAMEWARSNPNDPRSKAIMQRLGGQ